MTNNTTPLENNNNNNLFLCQGANPLSLSLSQLLFYIFYQSFLSLTLTNQLLNFVLFLNLLSIWFFFIGKLLKGNFSKGHVERLIL